MILSFAPSFLQPLAALVVMAGLGCAQVATAPQAPPPPNPALAPTPEASRAPEPVPPVTIHPEVKPVLRAKVILDGSSLTFSPDGWKLSPQGRKAIQQIVDELHSLGSESKLVVTGYSSNTGTEARKLALSRQRAEFVAKALTRAHVPREKIIVRGLGSENPIASNATKDGRLKNQRVEVEFQ
jgi:outer membrane protein OmpA-like peptidoglycan-associated protein